MSQQKTMEITKHLLAHDLEPLIREPIIAAAHRALSNNNGTYPEYREVQKALENDVSYSLVTISEVLLELNSAKLVTIFGLNQIILKKESGK